MMMMNHNRHLPLVGKQAQGQANTFAPSREGNWPRSCPNHTLPDLPPQCSSRPCHPVATCPVSTRTLPTDTRCTLCSSDHTYWESSSHMLGWESILIFTATMTHMHHYRNTHAAVHLARPCLPHMVRIPTCLYAGGPRRRRTKDTPPNEGSYPSPSPGRRRTQAPKLTLPHCRIVTLT